MNPSANWIELNDARTTEKLWVNMTMVTAIEVSAGYTRIRFDKDNFITVTQKPQQVFGLAGIPLQRKRQCYLPETRAGANCRLFPSGVLNAWPKLHQHSRHGDLYVAQYR